MDNILLLTDSYKVSHARQYPPGTQHVFSFFESRGGRYDEVLFFGLQYLVKQHLTGVVVTEAKIEEAKVFFKDHFGDETLFNEAGWRHILNVHGGRLPLEIRAVREGMRVPISNVLVTVVNTDPNVAWLTNYVETLLVQLWYPTTVATQSYHMKQTLLRYLDQTGTPEDVAFKLHDFGCRGSTSMESAGIGGAAHLVSFMGTDTVPALVMARQYYGAQMAGFSIPAAEHSTITSWGRTREAEAYQNMLTQYPNGLVAVVSDSYDVYAACSDLWGGSLKEHVLAREGVLVIRPDSGDPHEVLPELLSRLGDRFGYEINQKKYKVLNPKIRLIQGDGIDYESIDTILQAVTSQRWSADNLAFGSGGGLLQKLDRDTQKFAFKCCAVNVDGVWSDVLKDPVTDTGKRSKAGRLALVRRNGVPQTVPLHMADDQNLLEPVFLDGVLLRDQTFDNVRACVA